jgi:TetR/AcrR family transcriptional repressor of bet genes
MPRIGAEPVRRQSLIDAAIRLIGEQGSLDVSVKDIARRAGMSPALAFHYFGDKDAMIVATMRHLLAAYSREVAARLKLAGSPRQRLDAVIQASFSPAQFDQPTIAAWLVFYLRAYSSAEARRLLDVYSRRLRSNLMAGFRLILGDRDAVEQAAETVAALIDGLYIRHALRQKGPDGGEAIRLCLASVDRILGDANGKRSALQ